MPQLAQGLGFDLADAFTGDVELLADFLQRAGAAILQAEGAKQAKILEAEAEAQAILKVQQATADAIKLINEAAPGDGVIKIKALEAFQAAANGKATKIIIPSEIQGLAGLAASAKTLLEDDKPEQNQ